MYESLIKNNNSLRTVASQVQQSMEIIHSDITSAENLLETSRKANIFGTVVVSLVGLIGHFLIILVFGQKRFRTNSCNVYLLCLALNDSMFLIVHLLVDSLRSYKEIYLSVNDIYLSNSNKNTSSLTLINKLLLALNITDHSDFSCRFFMYMRYVLGFVSSYILVAFTLQRLLVIIEPLSSKYKHNRTAWFTISLIVMSAMLLNLWSMIIFGLNETEIDLPNTNNNNNNNNTNNRNNSIETVVIKFCDTNRAMSHIYFKITSIYIVFTILIPILIIFTCNIFIILNLFRAESKRHKALTATGTGTGTVTGTGTSTVLFVHNKSNTNRQQNSITIIALNNLKANNLKIEPIQNDQVSSNMNKHENLRRHIKPFYPSISNLVYNQDGAKMSHADSDLKKLSSVLLLVSSLFVILNVPYLTIWFYIFNQVNNQVNNISAGIDAIRHVQLFSALQITEIFYTIHYACLFYAYCASGTRFRAQLKYSICRCQQNNTANRRIKFFYE